MGKNKYLIRTPSNMKKYLQHIVCLLLLTSCFLLLTSASAQSPNAINYQAVARDAGGNPIANTAIYVEFKIWKTDPTIIGGGSVVYDETHSVTTNAYGLFNLIIASGSIVSGNFPTIPWGSDLFFLEVLVDPDAVGGLPYVSMGATQFLSVPYALHSTTADSLLNPPAGSFIWKRTADSVYLNTLTNRVGIGTVSPTAKLNVETIVGSEDALNVTHKGKGRAGVFWTNNSLNDSTTLISYTNGNGNAIFGINEGPKGHGGVFAVNNSSSGGIGLVGSTNGTGKAVFGYQTGLGYGGAFWINNPANDSAAVAGLTDGNGPAVWGLATGIGNAGVFQISNNASAASALYATTNGTGLAGEFVGKLKTTNFQMTNAPVAIGDILTSVDALGNAAWAAPPSAPPPAWLLGGNTLTGTLPASPNEWIGSLNAADFIFRTNNIERMRLRSVGTTYIAGDVAIANGTSPNVRLQVDDGNPARTTVNISSAGNPSAVGNGTALNVSKSGTNTAAFTSYGIQSLITNTGATSTNIAGYFSASGGTNNYAIIVPTTGGNVGIGTSSPLRPLHVVTGGTTDALLVEHTGTTSRAATFQITNASNGSAAVYGTTSGSGYGGYFTVGSTATAIMGYTTGSGRAGNFQIANTTNSFPAVDVTTNGQNSKALNVLHNGTTGTATSYGVYSATTGARGGAAINVGGYFSASGAPNNYAGIFNQGNVGIGTVSPNDKLTIVGGGTGGMTVRDQTDVIDAIHLASGTGAGASGSIELLNSGTTKVSFSGTGTNYINAGNVGIGTITPGAKLDIVSNSFDLLNLTTTAANTNVNVTINTTGAGAAQFQQTGGTGGFTFYPQGVVGTPTLAIIPFGTTGNVGIGIAAPNTSSILDITSTSKGLLVPRVSLISTGDVATITSPAISLLVYNTNVAMGGGGVGYWFWDGAKWVQLLNGGTGWSTTGNAGTVDNTNFIGTTDNVSLNFKVNGQKAGRIDAANANTFFGYVAGSTTTGGNNTANGYYSLWNNTTGASNTAIGTSALQSNVTGNYATAIGMSAMLYANNTATAFTNTNVAVGFEALRGSPIAGNNIGNANTALGYHTLLNITSGNSNTASGVNALYSNNTGSSNTASGDAALYSNNTGNNNTAIGRPALFSNTTGSSNTAIGFNALYYNVAGSNATAIGTNAMYYAYNGAAFINYNVAVGFEALRGSATPASNTGNSNTALGYQSLLNNSAGSGNTAIGYGALINNTTATGNTVLGYGAGSSFINGNNNTYIGYNTGANANGYINSTALGTGASVTGSNATAIGNGATAPANNVRLGNAAVTVISGQVAYTFPSDARFKENIMEDVKGIDFIMKLHPVSYNFNRLSFAKHIKEKTEGREDELTKLSQTRSVGFLAQDIEKIIKETGFEAFDAVHAPANETDNYSLSYSHFVIPLVKAIQEQQKMIDELRMTNDELKTTNNKLSTQYSILNTPLSNRK